jgi:hypothetical protein
MGKRPDGPSTRPCESCKTRPTYRARWQLGDRTEEHWFCPECDARESDGLLRSGAGMRLPTQVPFAVEGMDDRGGPSGWFLEVTEVALVHGDKPTLHFSDPKALSAALAQAKGPVKLVATETVGEPRRYLTADVTCDEQGLTRP